MAIRVFRWRAVGPLLAFAVLAGVLWTLFAEELARVTSEDVGTTVLGARVDIRRLDIHPGAGNVTLRGLTVASPFDSMRNLFEAEQVVADIDPLPLLEKKLVIDRVAVTGVRVGTPRTTPGFTARARRGSRVELVRREVNTWADRFDVPALRLATGKIDVGQLDPSRLETAQRATALAARVDSLRGAWAAAVGGLSLAPTLDSARVAAERLKKARATDLRAIADARKALDEVKRARARVTTLERTVASGVVGLREGLAALDQARQQDFALARSLVRLPRLDAPAIGAALFAPVAIERFQRALYWAELGRQHMPPGLLPRASKGPDRVRRSGTSVRFPRERAYPGFLLRAAELSIELGGGEADAPRRIAGRLTGVTSAPALYGRPAVFEGSAPGVVVGALVDHVRGTPRDTAGARLERVSLPALKLPGLPFRLEPGRGVMGLTFAMRGDTMQARWTVRAPAVSWIRDTAAGGEIERLVGRVLDRVRELDLTAEVGGTLKAPRLSIRSNLDRALADALSAALGEEVQAAERRLRSEVDRLVEQQAAPVRARAAALEQEAKARVSEQAERLDQVQNDLEQRLRDLTRGIRLP